MIKDILAFANDGALSDSAVGLPLSIAKRFGARLSAVYVDPPPYTYVPVEPGLTSAELAEAAVLSAQKLLSESTAKFRSLQREHGFTGDWHLVKWWDEAVSLGFQSDLLVVRQGDWAIPEIISGQGPEHIALTSGRPTLVVPAKGSFNDCGHRVLIAWKPTREATRAVHDSLALLHPGAEVTILEVNAPAKPKTMEGMAAHLQRLGLNAKSETAREGTGSVCEIILRRAKDLNADLIVMGAYGHSRLREFVLGGVTREMLKAMPIPVLMSH
jgi:nucleotide-binding universal stress UspA family protein